MRLKPALIMLAVFALVAGALAVFLARYEGEPGGRAADGAVNRLLDGLEPARVQQVEIVNAEVGRKPVILDRVGPHKWVLGSPVQGLASADLVEKLLAWVTQAEAERVLAATDMTAYGLERPVLRLTLRAGERVHTLELGAAAPMVAPASAESYVDLSLREIEGGRKPEPYRYMRLDGKEEVLIVRDALQHLIDAPTEAFREPRLFHAEREGRIGPLEPSDVLGITIARKGLTLVVERPDDGRWRLMQPVNARADAAGVEAMLRSLLTLRAAAPGGFVQTDPAALGFDQPAVGITLMTRDGGSHVIRLRQSGPDAETPSIYALNDARQVALQFPPDALAVILQAGAETFRDRRLVLLDGDATHAWSVAWAGQPPLRLVRRSDEPGTWHLTEPVSGRADSDGVARLMRRYGELAVEPGGYVDDAPADLARYGLDKPSLTASFSRKDAAEPYAKILIGRSPKDAPERVYAKNANEPSVVLLDKGAVEALKPDVAALRSRTLLEGFDRWTAHQIFTTVGGAESLHLARGKQPTWAFVKPQGVPVEFTAPSDFLAVVAGLQVIDFVADRPKDYAPYGLDKPRAELTVKTAAGAGRGEQTFALHFGKRTGEGARCYVRLPSEPNVYEVPAELLNRIESGALEFRDRQILALKPGRMTAIDLRNHRATYEALRGPSAGVWLLNSPILAVGDRVAFAELVILMTELRAKRLVAEKGLANPIYGLAPKAGEPYQKVVLTLAKAADEAATSEATLLVGAPCGDEGDRYAAMLDSGLVFVMAGEDVKKLDAEFLSPVVINHVPDGVSQVKVVHRDGSCRGAAGARMGGDQPPGHRRRPPKGRGLGRGRRMDSGRAVRQL